MPQEVDFCKVQYHAGTASAFNTDQDNWVVGWSLCHVTEGSLLGLSLILGDTTITISPGTMLAKVYYIHPQDVSRRPISPSQCQLQTEGMHSIMWGLSFDGSGNWKEPDLEIEQELRLVLMCHQVAFAKHYGDYRYTEAIIFVISIGDSLPA